MALAETLSVDKLVELYEDDWHNLYKPLSFEDTNLVGATASSAIAGDNLLQSKINDIFNRQSAIEDLFGDMQRLPEEMSQISTEFENVRSTVEEVKNTQNEIKGFLDDILDFENQGGQRID